MSNVEATSLIKEALNGFITNFPKTRVRYEFDINANVHCIEIVPNHIYHLENDYIEWENKFTNNFIALFPEQNICFFSDDALVGINHIQFELEGSRYVELTSTNEGKVPANQGLFVKIDK